jgi:hypothetical protein
MRSIITLPWRTQTPEKQAGFHVAADLQAWETAGTGRARKSESREPEKEAETTGAAMH